MMEQPSSKALFTPAKTQRASEAIYNQIYPKIISGELRPGDRLPPERELAEMFQRSRPVVREALRMLQQEGLIETAVGSSGGAVIQGVSLKSVEEPLKNLVAMGAINLDELLEYRHINDRSCAVWLPSTHGGGCRGAPADPGGREGQPGQPLQLPGV
ncbi:MAG: FadR/GntR family transcriptional regulator [Dysosmobacter welbionis]